MKGRTSENGGPQQTTARRIAMRISVMIVGTAFLVFLGAPRSSVAGIAEDCREWCAAHPECDRCSKRLGCGVGYKTIKRFTDRGKSWYACDRIGEGGRASSSQGNEAACRRWCAEDSECAKCSDLAECGSGFRKIKSWTGKGKDWHACAKR
jgi:hypothetical protein